MKKRRMETIICQILRQKRTIMLGSVEVKDLTTEIMGPVTRGRSLSQAEILSPSIDTHHGSTRHTMMIFMWTEQEVILWSCLGASGMEATAITNKISGIGILASRILVHMLQIRISTNLIMMMEHTICMASMIVMAGLLTEEE